MLGAPLAFGLEVDHCFKHLGRGRVSGCAGPSSLAVDVSTLSRVDLNHRILNKIVEICATTSSMDGMGGMGM
jgi:hypothetical protein